MPTRDPYRVPERLRNRYEQIVEADRPPRSRAPERRVRGLRPAHGGRARAQAPLAAGERAPRTWAAGILYAVGWVNFLSDPKQDPHMTTAELADRAGVGQSTIAAQFGKIRDALGLWRLSLEWTLPGRLADNPLVWILKVNGHLVDIRTMPRDAQEAAFDAGLIPFIPADDAPPGPEVRSKGAEAKPRATAAEGQRTRRSSDPERVYQLKITLGDVRPAIWRRVLVPEDTTLVGLHRVIQAAMGWEDYHLRRFELGDVEYAEPSDEEWRPTEDARQGRLGQVAGRCCVLRYVYEYGDDNEVNV